MCFRFLQVCVSFLRTGEIPHHDHGKVEGLEEVSLEPGEEDEIYRMQDDLHPRDLRSGNERRQDRGGAPPDSAERRSGTDRRKEVRRDGDTPKGGKQP
jgi:C4-dicarboxylate transporter DctQ subunit